MRQEEPIFGWKNYPRRGDDKVVLFPRHIARIPPRTGERHGGITLRLLLWDRIPDNRTSVVVTLASQAQARIVEGPRLQRLVASTPTKTVTVIAVIYRRDFPVVVVLVVSKNRYGHWGSVTEERFDGTKKRRLCLDIL